MPLQESVRIAGKNLGDMFCEQACRKECRIEEWHMMPDHVNMLISIPPKHKVNVFVGFIKDKSTIWIERRCNGHGRNFTGQEFRTRGCYVSTVGRDERLIREYIRNLEKQLA